MTAYRAETIGDFPAAFSKAEAEANRLAAAGKVVLVEVTEEEPTGKWGMARIWRKWMSQTAEWMSRQGATMPLCFDKDGKPYGSREFNAADAHELFTAQWLGLSKDGERLSWSRKGRDGMRAATKSERFHAMQRHESWSVERGINLFNPREENEYRQIESDCCEW
jgi:hypothetical protein